MLRVERRSAVHQNRSHARDKRLVIRQGSPPCARHEQQHLQCFHLDRARAIQHCEPHALRTKSVTVYIGPAASHPEKNRSRVTRRPQTALHRPCQVLSYLSSVGFLANINALRVKGKVLAINTQYSAPATSAFPPRNADDLRCAASTEPRSTLLSGHRTTTTIELSAEFCIAVESRRNPYVDLHWLYPDSRAAGPPRPRFRRRA